MEEKTITLVLDDLKTLRDRNMIDKNMRIAECIDNGIHTIRKLQQQDKRLRMLLDIKMDNSGYKPIIGFDDIAKETIELVYHDITKERDTYKKQLDEVKEYMQKSVYSATGITHLQEKDGKVTGRAVVGVRIIGNEEDFLIGLMKRLESEVE